MSGPYHVDTTQKEHDEPITPLPNFSYNELVREHNNLLFDVVRHTRIGGEAWA